MSALEDILLGTAQRLWARSPDAATLVSQETRWAPDKLRSPGKSLISGHRAFTWEWWGGLGEPQTTSDPVKWGSSWGSLMTDVGPGHLYPRLPRVGWTAYGTRGWPWFPQTLCAWKGARGKWDLRQSHPSMQVLPGHLVSPPLTRGGSCILSNH